ARPPPKVPTNNAVQVANHYNQHQQQSHEERKQSKIYRLRSFNNWTKSVLIAQAVKQRPTRRVLDMGCGKGGDLLKWAKARIDYYVGVDIASVSIDQARGRWHDIRHNRFRADFYALDCYENPLEQVIPRGEQFDIVTQQFCLHYAFETEHKARQMVKNVADHLSRGGRWIGTLPDAYWIAKKLQASDGLRFGNSVYYIEFDQKDTFPTYGHRYVFHLE
ncbi:guanine-N(7)-methyltransferase domain-containing protein, partial [Syncephalis pseudoplumigaleata]